MPAAWETQCSESVLDRLESTWRALGHRDLKAAYEELQQKYKKVQRRPTYKKPNWTGHASWAWSQEQMRMNPEEQGLVGVERERAVARHRQLYNALPEPQKKAYAASHRQALSFAE